MSQLEMNPMSRRTDDDIYRPAPRPRPRARPAHAEGTWTRVIEQQTARIPSAAFLVGALGAMAGSLGLELANRTRWSRFVGMWAPTLLVVGVYNKLVKTFGPT
jgi:hypothetical protein